MKIISFFLFFCTSILVLSETNYLNGNLESLEVGQIREIEFSELAEIVRARHPNIFIIDARFKKFDDDHRIPGSKPLPADSLEKDILSALPDKTAIVIVYCSNPRCPAAGVLGKRLLELGYANVWKYSGGLKEWKMSGQKLEQSANLATLKQQGSG